MEASEQVVVDEETATVAATASVHSGDREGVSPLPPTVSAAVSAPAATAFAASEIGDSIGKESPAALNPDHAFDRDDAPSSSSPPQTAGEPISLANQHPSELPPPDSDVAPGPAVLAPPPAPIQPAKETTAVAPTATVAPAEAEAAEQPPTQQTPSTGGAGVDGNSSLGADSQGGAGGGEGGGGSTAAAVADSNSMGLDDYIQSPEVQNAIMERSPGGRYVRFSEKLGSGASKDVYRAYDTQEGIEVAWNVVNLSGVPKTERNRIVNEVRLLERLHHHNIISFHGSWVNRERQEVNFVTEILSSGTLKSFINKVQVIRWKIAKRWAVQILQGLQYLHSQDPPVIHRDLKCENIFINGTSGDLRIGDLGLSTVHRNGRVLSVLGTPEFMAPDMYEEQSYDEKVDIYAFGMCMLEIFTKEIPYRECMNPAQIYKKVSSGEPPEVLSRLQSRNAREFVVLCLGYKDENGRYVRPSASELLQHPFLEKRASDEDEVFVDPPLYERVIAEAGESQSSPVGTPSSKSRGQGFNDVSVGSGVGRESGRADVFPDATTALPASPPPSQPTNRSRASSLSDNDGDQFDEMPQSETQMRKVKVMMGRGRELEEDEGPTETVRSKSAENIDPPPKEVLAPSAPASVVAPLTLPEAEPTAVAMPQIPPPSQHYLVAAAVIENENPHARPYPDDVLKLVVTLPVEGQTQNVQFDFHLIEDDPVKVAKEMVQELGIPQGAVLEISETISGLACAARMKVEKFHHRQQPLPQPLPRPDAHQPLNGHPNAGALAAALVQPGSDPNVSHAVAPQQNLYVQHGNVAFANHDRNLPPVALHQQHSSTPQQVPFTAPPSSAQYVQPGQGLAPALGATPSRLVPASVPVRLPSHGSDYSVSAPLVPMQQQHILSHGLVAHSHMVPTGTTAEQIGSAQHVAMSLPSQQHNPATSVQSGPIHGAAQVVHSHLSSTHSSTSQPIGVPIATGHSFYSQGMAQHHGLPANPILMQPQAFAASADVSKASYQQIYSAQQHGMMTQDDNSRTSHLSAPPQTLAPAPSVVPSHDSSQISQGTLPPQTHFAPAHGQPHGGFVSNPNANQGSPSLSGQQGFDNRQTVAHGVSIEPAGGQHGQASFAAPTIERSIVQPQLSDQSLPSYSRPESVSHTRRQTSPESIPVPGTLSQRANTTGTSSTLGSDDSEHRRRLLSFGSAGQSPPPLDEEVDTDPILDEDLKKLEEEFERNLQRAKKVFDNRMDNLQRSQIEREAQHQKTLEKHMKERAEFEKRLAQEEEQQLRRMEQLQREWEKKREALACLKRQQSHNAAPTTVNGFLAPLSATEQLGAMGGVGSVQGEAHRRQVSGNMSSQEMASATLDQLHTQHQSVNGGQDPR